MNGSSSNSNTNDKVNNNNKCHCIAVIFACMEVKDFPLGYFGLANKNYILL